jgi:ABC-type phosphate/phosphonate transport system substrate-binding protein
VPKELQDTIVSALLDIAKTDEGKKAINTAYQWTALEQHDDTFYDPFRQFLQAAGVKAADLLPKPKQ